MTKLKSKKQKQIAFTKKKSLVGLTIDVNYTNILMLLNTAFIPADLCHNSILAQGIEHTAQSVGVNFSFCPLVELGTILFVKLDGTIDTICHTLWLVKSTPGVNRIQLKHYY